MSIAKLLLAPFRYRLWIPRHLNLVAADLAGTSRQTADTHQAHLVATVDWLCRAQDLRDGHPDAGGVSAGWSFEDGWLPGYPETSGYIVETFVAAAEVLARPELRERASRILDWELSIQNDDGSFPGHFGEQGSRPVIFNTGQIMHGMVAGFLELGRADCLEAAVRAGRWMAACQDDDGCWRQNVHNGVPHTYNTRAAWALLRTGIQAGAGDLKAAAERNIDWALTRQTGSAWFSENAFTPDRSPFTHTIAYAIRGILEAGLLTERDRWVQAARKAARALADRQRDDGWLAGTYDDHWTATSSYCCLTGLAQTVLIWERLRQTSHDAGLSEHIERGLDYLKRNHRLLGTGGPADGGVAGSAPIWGRYSMFEYPNWAAKFFADALMMDMRPVAIPADRMPEN